MSSFLEVDNDDSLFKPVFQHSLLISPMFSSHSPFDFYIFPFFILWVFLSIPFLVSKGFLFFFLIYLLQRSFSLETLWKDLSLDFLKSKQITENEVFSIMGIINLFFFLEKKGYISHRKVKKRAKKKRVRSWNWLIHCEVTLIFLINL